MTMPSTTPAATPATNPTKRKTAVRRPTIQISAQRNSFRRLTFGCSPFIDLHAGALHNLDEFRRVSHLQCARPREWNDRLLDDLAWARPHNADSCREIDCLTEVMGDEKDGRAMRHPELLQDAPELLARELI